MLTAENIRFGYSPENELIDGMSFNINHGDTVCLLGPNGAGKTTLLRCLLGFSKLKGGKITLEGRTLTSYSPKELAKKIAYVPQIATAVFPYKVIEIVLMGRTPHLRFASVPSAKDVAIAGEILTDLGIAHLSNRLFSEISGGEQQLTLIARALTQQAKLLIMDEPTASLDYGNQVKILKVIDKLSKAGYTIVMTSHFPNHAFSTCTKVILLKNGHIKAYGEPDAIITEETLSELYDTSVKLFQIDSAEGSSYKICLPEI